MDDVADVRVPRGQHVPILERFAEEAPHLRPLPCRPYDTARVIYRICDSMGCIAWDGNLYEVSYEHVTDFLPVRITSEQVLIYGRDLSCIATHAAPGEALELGPHELRQRTLTALLEAREEPREVPAHEYRCVAVVGLRGT